MIHDTAIAKGRDKRINEIIQYHISKSKRKGDYHFRMAEYWGADGDYIRGMDDGEPPRGAEEH
jgi:hypothetical protein